jgi:hypothetical protein
VKGLGGIIEKRPRKIQRNFYEAMPYRIQDEVLFQAMGAEVYGSTERNLCLPANKKSEDAVSDFLPYL